MKPEEKSLKGNRSTYQLEEDIRIRNLLISEINRIYYFWKIRFLWDKIKTYATDPKKIIYKLDVFIHKIQGKNVSSIKPFPDTFSNAYKNRLLKYVFLLDKKRNRDEDIIKIQNIINANNDRKIVVYPQTIFWEPLQRPQQLMRELGKNGYLCFFCEPESTKLLVNQVGENVYTISGEKYLVFPLHNRPVIALCTWMLNLPFLYMLNQKFIWYDIIDRLELFSLYDADMLDCHNNIVVSANLITYSGKELKNLTASRDDAMYLPNGVVYEDFFTDEKVGSKLSDVNNRKFLSIQKPIIGFYGAIAEWLDYELITRLAQIQQDWNFVFIGKIWTDIGKIKEIPNIHFLGLIPYQDLPHFAKKFDVAIIPFLVNQITDSVSPIKLFEYAALGKPVVATPFYEITQYCDQPFIRLANTAEEFSEKIEELLHIPPESIEAQARLFAQINHWKERIKSIEHKFTG